MENLEAWHHDKPGKLYSQSQGKHQVKGGLETDYVFGTRQQINIPWKQYRRPLVKVQPVWTQYIEDDKIMRRPLCTTECVEFSRATT